jgi:hypothetical protein
MFLREHLHEEFDPVNEQRGEHAYAECNNPSEGTTPQLILVKPGQIVPTLNRDINVVTVGRERWAIHSRGKVDFKISSLLKNAAQSQDFHLLDPFVSGVAPLNQIGQCILEALP